MEPCLALVFYRIGLNWLIAIVGPVGVVVLVAYSVWLGLTFDITRHAPGPVRLGGIVVGLADRLPRAGGSAERGWLSRLRFAYLALGYSQPAG